MIVYALTNQRSFQQDWVKIGKTTRDAETRRAELSRTSVPYPFDLEMAYETDDDGAESKLHLKFDSDRIRRNREFFTVGLDDVRAAMIGLRNARDVTDEVRRNPSLFPELIDIEEKQPLPPPRVAIAGRAIPRKWARFYLMGLFEGDEIRSSVFSSTAFIAGDREIRFRDQITSCRQATLKLYEENPGLVHGTADYAGKIALKLWSHNSKSLWNIYYETYEASRAAYEVGY